MFSFLQFILLFWIRLCRGCGFIFVHCTLERIQIVYALCRRMSGIGNSICSQHTHTHKFLHIARAERKGNTFNQKCYRTKVNWITYGVSCVSGTELLNWGELQVVGDAKDARWCICNTRGYLSIPSCSRLSSVCEFSVRAQLWGVWRGVEDGTGRCCRHDKVSAPKITKVVIDVINMCKHTHVSAISESELSCLHPYGLLVDD